MTEQTLEVGGSFRAFRLLSLTATIELPYFVTINNTYQPAVRTRKGSRTAANPGGQKFGTFVKKDRAGALGEILSLQLNRCPGWKQARAILAGLPKAAHKRIEITDSWIFYSCQHDFDTNDYPTNAVKFVEDTVAAWLGYNDVRVIEHYRTRKEVSDLVGKVRMEVTLDIKIPEEALSDK